MNLNEYPLWTALITPMLENGEVDYTSLEGLLKEQEEAKNGLLLLGSTGESLNLDLEDQKKILDFAFSLKLTSPIMVGVGGINIKKTKEWVQYLETLPVHAYLMVVPLYAKPNAMGQYLWFKELMDTSTRPVMLYNIPGRTGKALELKTLEMLKDHPNLWAIKEASGSADEFKAYAETAPNAVMMSGDDPMLPAYIPHGCKGLVSVASNAWPSKTHLYVEKALANQLKEDDKKLWKEASESLFTASNPIPVKKLIQAEGRIKTSTLRLPLTDLDLEDCSLQKNYSQKIKNWN